MEMISKGQSKRLQGKTHIPPSFPAGAAAEEICKLTHAWRNLLVPGSPEHQHEFLHPAEQLALPRLAKIKPYFSNTLARTVYSVLKNYFSSYPPRKTALMWGRPLAYGAENHPADMKAKKRHCREKGG